MDGKHKPSSITSDRDEKGRFLTGNNGGGRPRGSRNKLGEEFLDDLIDEWRDKGKKALELCATREPTQFVKIVANILPREVLVQALNINATVDLSEMERQRGFLEAYRYARDRIGAPLKHESLEHIEEGELFTEGWRLADE